MVRQTDRTKGRQKDKYLDRHTDRQKDKYVDRQIDRHTDRWISVMLCPEIDFSGIII